MIFKFYECAMNHQRDLQLNPLKIFMILFSSFCFQLSCAPAPFQNYIRESDLNKKVKQEYNLQCFLLWSESNSDQLPNETQNRICMKLNWLSDLKSSQWLEAEVEFIQNETGVSTLPPQGWKFVPWMPSMGHGAGRPVVVEEMTPSRFRISKIYFTMKGEWIIQLKQGKNVLVESKLFFVP